MKMRSAMHHSSYKCIIYPPDSMKMHTTHPKKSYRQDMYNEGILVDGFLKTSETDWGFPMCLLTSSYRVSSLVFSHCYLLNFTNNAKLYKDKNKNSTNKISHKIIFVHRG